MASIRGVRWALCGWGLLFGVLQVAHGAERINVPLPSVQDLLNRANPVINENSIGYVQAHDSAFQYQQRSYSAPIQQKVTIPKAAIKDVVKSGLKSQAAVVAVNVAVAAAVAAAGWVIDEAGQPVKKLDGSPVSGSSPSDYYWHMDGEKEKFASAPQVCASSADSVRRYYPDINNARPQYQSATSALCVADGFPGKNDKNANLGTAYREGSTCPANSSYSTTSGGCVGTTNAPVTAADYDTLDIKCEDSLICKDMIQRSCAASTAPARCYQALQDAASFLNSGPSSIQGPKSTTTTTNKNADGTVSTETTTKDTKFDMKYDGTGATATPSTTTTTKDGKGGESTSTDKEDEDSDSGTAAKPDDEKEAPVPCATNCDGPVYKDLYTKTDVTKEGVIDGYAAKVQSLPIVSSVRNFFTVSGGGACPVWSGTFAIDVGFYSKSFTLTFDFACQPWFTALSPAFHALFMLLGVWAAFRVSILD